MTRTNQSRPLGLLALLLIGLLAAGCSVTAATPGEGTSAGVSAPSTGGDDGASGDGGGGAPGAGGAPKTSGPDAPVTSDPGSPGEPPVGDGATHVKPEPGIVNATPHAFDHVSVAADGKTLTIYYWGGVQDCYGLASVKVKRNEDGTLAITVMEGTRAAATDKVCIEIALLKAVTVTLDEPVFLPGGTGPAE